MVAPADISVQALSLTGSAATNGNLVGPNARFAIATATGSVTVDGAVAISSAGANDLFAISAGNRITVFTPTGSIALTGSGTTPGGRISLSAQRIAIGSQAAVTALDGLTGVDAKDARFAANDGNASEAGFLQANGIAFAVSSGVYIQNSGTDRRSDARRGFTVGSDGLSITTTGTGPAEIVINGRQTGGDTGFITGADLIPLLRLTGLSANGVATMASFDPRSTANGCLITGLSCRFDVVPPTTPVQDVINQLINSDSLVGGISTVVQQLNSPLIELNDFTPFRLAGIIDEPVTGAGNEDFYASFLTDDAFSTGVTINEQVTGTGNDLTTDPSQGADKCDPALKVKDPDCK